MKKILILPIIVLILFVIGCSTQKDITSFSFENPSAEGTISQESKSISVTVPYGTDVTALVPAISHEGDSISPPSGAAQDFTNPVVYTVKADDTTTRQYTVTVTIAPASTAKAITSFAFEGVDADVVISEATHSIIVTVPGMDISSLIPVMTYTGVSVSPSSGVAKSFLSPVVYTVTAQDSSTQDYTVTVTVDPWIDCGDTLTYAGENYPTVQIGTQCWLAKNLNAGTMVTLISGQGISCASIRKYCYNNTASNCTTYGGLYTWTQAMCGAETAGSRGVCPTGWHIPTDPEYVTLTNYTGSASCATYRQGDTNDSSYCGAPAGDRLKAVGLCQGRSPCGDSGFDALLGGITSGSVFVDFGNIAQFWTSSKGSDTEAWQTGLALNLGGVNSTYWWSPFSQGRAIRCIKD